MNTMLRRSGSALALVLLFAPAVAVAAAATPVAAPVAGDAVSASPATVPTDATSRQAPLSPADAARVIASAEPPQVLDVRTADEFADGHVPGAVLIPHDELEARLAELDPARPVLVYCRSGRRSTLAETLLVERGFDVRQIDGSWLRWQEEGLPVSTPTASAPVLAAPVPTAGAGETENRE